MSTRVQYPVSVRFTAGCEFQSVEDHQPLHPASDSGSTSSAGVCGLETKNVSRLGCIVGRYGTGLASTCLLDFISHLMVDTRCIYVVAQCTTYCPYDIPLTLQQARAVVLPSISLVHGVAACEKRLFLCLVVKCV